MSNYDDETSFLAIILDCNPFFWGPKELDKDDITNSSLEMKSNDINKDNKKSKKIKKKMPFGIAEFIDSVLIFCNAFLTLHRGNKLGIFGITPKESKKLYVSSIGTTALKNRKENLLSEFSFTGMNESIKKGVLSLMTPFINNNSNNNISLSNGSLLSGGLSNALCLINRVLTCELSCIDSRILILSTSSDISSQYIPIMNCIFSAQKINVTIDSCILTNNESIFLQQASYLTKGIYSKPLIFNGLLQHLLMTHLSSKNIRKHLTLNTINKVDFRASCFCHQKPVDIGYVCPVCLSIFCKQLIMCKTCSTRFPNH